MWGAGARAPVSPAERMGGGAYRMGGAARVSVTSDSRVRSSRGVAGSQSGPDEQPGLGILPSLQTQDEKTKDPLEREKQKVPSV